MPNLNDLNAVKKKLSESQLYRNQVAGDLGVLANNLDKATNAAQINDVHGEIVRIIRNLENLLSDYNSSR